jgi:hypothetical protein
MSNWPYNTLNIIPGVYYGCTPVYYGALPPKPEFPAPDFAPPMWYDPFKPVDGTPEYPVIIKCDIYPKGYERAQLPCHCDEFPPNALHWEWCPAGRDSRSHNDGLEFLRVWIIGHFGKLNLDTPTLHKIIQMIDVIGPKIRNIPSIDEYT